MLTKKERETLNAAAEIITRNLCEQGELGLRGVGKFYISEAPVRDGMGEGRATRKVVTVRFRPWDALKYLVRKAVSPGKVIASSEARADTFAYRPEAQVEETISGDMTADAEIVCENCGATHAFVQAECDNCGLPLKI